jgi:hypothetical protein
MMMRSRTIAILTLVLSASMLSHAAAATQLAVRQELWGFDGRVVQSRFAPLSLLIENISDKPFNGVLILTHNEGSGAKLVERVYLAPGNMR